MGKQMKFGIKYLCLLAGFSLMISCKAQKQAAQNKPAPSPTVSTDTIPKQRDENKQVIADNLRREKARKFYEEGLAKRDAGDLLGAVSSFTQAIITDTMYLDAYYERATANAALHMFNSAASDDQFLYEQSYRNPVVYARVAQRWGAVEDWAKALEVYNKGVSLFDTSLLLLNQLANLQVHLNKFEDAVKTYERQIALGAPETAIFFANYGYSLSRIGDNRRAAFFLTKSIDLNPSDRLIYAFRGFAFLNIHQFAMAESDYRFFLEENPMDLQGNYNLARSLYEQKKFEEAITRFKKVDFLQTKYLDTYYLMGLCYGGLNDYKTALTWLDKAIEQDPNKAIYYSNRGIAKGQMGVNTNFCPDFQKALDLGFAEAQTMLDRYCKK
jgi:tetratricopeptide (TPR) repeat protein